MRTSKGQTDICGGVSVKRVRLAEGHVDQRGRNRIHDTYQSSQPHTAREAREVEHHRRGPGTWWEGEGERSEAGLFA